MAPRSQRSVTNTKTKKAAPKKAANKKAAPKKAATKKAAAKKAAAKKAANKAVGKDISKTATTKPGTKIARRPAASVEPPLASNTSGAGHRITLVHGFTQTGASWRQIADVLSNDYEVRTVDAPGHGGSASVKAGLWRCGELIAQTGGPGTYIGYSMGARMCLHSALVRPEQVQRLIVLGAHGGIDSDTERMLRRTSDDTLAESIERDGVAAFLDRWLAQPMFAGLPDDRASRLVNTALGLASSLRLAGTGSQDPLWSRLHEIDVPVLVLAGSRDDKFEAIGLRLAAAIGPNATFLTVPDAGHAAHLEQRNAFITIVRSWLQATRNAVPAPQRARKSSSTAKPAKQKAAKAQAVSQRPKDSTRPKAN
ncbi:MAG: alpha/beta fold hydrolase [Acidimicrobiia bacterium]